MKKERSSDENTMAISMSLFYYILYWHIPLTLISFKSTFRKMLSASCAQYTKGLGDSDGMVPRHL